MEEQTLMATPREPLIGLNNTILSKISLLVPMKERVKSFVKNITCQGPPQTNIALLRSLDKQYFIFFDGFYCKIMLKVKGTNKLLSWNLFPKQYIPDDLCPRSLYDVFHPVRDETQVVPQAVALFLDIFNFLPGVLEVITVSGATFEDMGSAVENATCIGSIGECNVLRLDGDYNLTRIGRREMNAACTILLNKLIVRKRISTRSIYPTDHLKLRHLMCTPIAELALPESTVWNLLDSASKKGKYTIKDCSLADLNYFILLWLRSSSQHIHRMNIKILNAEGGHIYKLFTGLVHHGEAAPCCSFTKECSNSNCNNMKQAHLKITGVNLHRSDGAIATVFYSAALPQYTFAFYVSYPGESSQERCDKYKNMLANIHRSHRNMLANYQKSFSTHEVLLRWIPDHPNNSLAAVLFVLNRAAYLTEQWDLHEQSSLSDDAKKMELFVFQRKEHRESYGYLSLE